MDSTGNSVVLITPRLLLLLVLAVGALGCHMLLAILDSSGNFRSYPHRHASVNLKNVTKKKESLHRCSPLSELGPITVNVSTKMDLEELNKLYPEVAWGGQYSPSNCTSQKVAIIVPYRSRFQHLVIFLNHMHPFLMKQQMEYAIYAIEQQGNGPFNRGKLLNVGFQESVRLSTNHWRCFVFHDVDLLPLDTRNLYSCPAQPRHMSVLIDKFKFRLPYIGLIGGVLAMTFEQFTNVNGFANGYWGWGGEDDDMYQRIRRKRYRVTRYNKSIARYIMLNHSSSTPNPKRHRLLYGHKFLDEGLSTLDYKVIVVKKMRLFTYVLVNIGEMPSSKMSPNQTFITETIKKGLEVGF